MLSSCAKCERDCSWDHHRACASSTRWIWGPGPPRRVSRKSETSRSADPLPDPLQPGTEEVRAAAGTIAQRMRGIKLAKQSGSSWVKAELVSLLASNQASSSALPEQALAL